jgi:peptide chain release factor 2
MSFGGIFDIATKERRLAALDTEMGAPSFWEDNRRAQELIRERTDLARTVTRVAELATRAQDLDVFLELAAEAGDGSLDAEIGEGITGLRRELDEFELKVMLSGSHDVKPAILSIHPGAGGTESQDWAQMLMRTYLRWCERAGFKAEVVDLLPVKKPGSSRSRSRSPATTPTVICAARPACIGSCGSPPSIPRAAARRASRRFP